MSGSTRVCGVIVACFGTEYYDLEPAMLNCHVIVKLMFMTQAFTDVLHGYVNCSPRRGVGDRPSCIPWCIYSTGIEEAPAFVEFSYSVGKYNQEGTFYIHMSNVPSGGV